ncbi:trypsin-like peptidase domain-containing protein [Patescibacteria group bacterium]|nr:trypsin-like peptidase domain-containing protein [Patescibacteria group bacterium]
MSLYQLPKFEFPKLAKPKFLPCWKNRTLWLLVLVIVFSSIFGFLAGGISGSFFYSKIRDELLKFNISLPEPRTIEKEKIVEKEPVYLPQTSQEDATIKVVKETSPAVVSIVITKDVPKLKLYYESPFQEFEQFFGQPFELKIPQYKQEGTEKKEIGGGTGFIISEDGMVLTNAHVVSDKEADYTVLTNDGKKYPAKVLTRDTIRDLAVMKIAGEKTIDEEGKLNLKSFPPLKLGDSAQLQIGQTVIAIGNALGEFRNTVSVGVISGLGRTVTASGGGMIETLEDVIQTDAALNRGNSGGPLLNLKGEVIGVNFAIGEQAQSIGFSIPINQAKKGIEQVKTLGKIVYPFLGVRYVLINKKIQKENNLSVDYGAFIGKGGGGEPAVFPGSAAEKIGLKEGDTILEFAGEKITSENTLAKIIMKYNPGDKVVLKILPARLASQGEAGGRNGKEINVEVVLDERSE